MANRSLDEFTSERDEQTASEPPSTAAPTMIWTPEGADCSECNETAQRLWQADDRADRSVCSACKQWE